MSVIEPLEPRRLLSASAVVHAKARTFPAAGLVVPQGQSVSEPATGSGVAVDTVSQSRFRGPVARIQSPPDVVDPPRVRWVWRARVEWGDGRRRTRARVLPAAIDAPRELDVVGTHKYRKRGSYTVTVSAVGRPRGAGAAGVPVQRLELTTTATVSRAEGLLPVTLSRAGGFVGDNRTITVNPTGRLTATGRFSPFVSRQLTGAEQGELRQAFAGWESLRDRYGAPGVIFDGYTYTLSYGGKQVEVPDGAVNVPPSFLAALRLLETLAGEPDPPVPLEPDLSVPHPTGG